MSETSAGDGGDGSDDGQAGAGQPENAGGAEFASAGSDAFLVTEVERFGVATQEVVASADGLATEAAESGGITLGVDTAAEDLAGRQTLVLVGPEPASTDGPGGRLVLTVSPAGVEPITIHGVRWSDAATGETEVEIEVDAGAVVAGRWGYSLRPRSRTVFVSDDEQAFGEDTSVIHQADLGAEAVAPELTATDGDRQRQTFAVPVWLTDRVEELHRCELFVDRLAIEAGDDDLRLPESLVTVEELDRVATEIEGAAGDGTRLSITVETPGQEIVRGQRLQPLTRYPITVVGSGGEPVAATLGCSVSG